MRAEITLAFSSSTLPHRILDAVEPDNIPLPSGLSIKSAVKECSLHIIVECERGTDTFRGTLEDLMSAIDLAYRTANSITVDC